jgi:hypothetical protein
MQVSAPLFPEKAGAHPLYTRPRCTFAVDVRAAQRANKGTA